MISPAEYDNKHKGLPNSFNDAEEASNFKHLEKVTVSRVAMGGRSGAGWVLGTTSEARSWP